MTNSKIELELLEPADLNFLIDSKLKEQGCPVCAINGHIIWDIIIRGLGQIQLFNCDHCKDAVAVLQFARDMVRVLKLGKQPEYPQNFQYWITQLAMLRLSDKKSVVVPTSEILDDDSIKSIEKIRKLAKQDNVEYAFCSTEPRKITKGDKTGILAPVNCQNAVVVHNHPSQILEMSTPDNIAACKLDSIMCIIGDNETKCYNCEGELVESIPSKASLNKSDS